MTLETWSVFAAAAMLLCLSPGANNLMALSNGLRFGVTRSLVAVGGRLAAFAVMIAITAVGLGAVLAASEIAFQVIKWAGVAYLLYLGIRALRAPAATLDDDGPVRASRSSIWRARNSWSPSGIPRRSSSSPRSSRSFWRRTNRRCRNSR